MAHHTDAVGFPSLPMRVGMIIKLEARSPSTDAEVAGVSATRWAIYGDSQGAGPGLEDEIPLYSTTEVEG